MHKSLSVIDKRYLAYYSLLAIITLFLTKPDVEYSSIFRIVYFALIIIPCLVYPKYFPVVSIVFFGFSVCSFSPFIPSTVLIVFGGCFLVAISNYSNRKAFQFNFLLIFASIYFLLGSILYPLENDAYNSNILLVILFSIFFQKEDNESQMAFGFAFLSLMISLLYLYHLSDFSVVYMANYAQEIERSSWINPNIFGGHIACGLVSAAWLLLSNKRITSYKFSYKFILWLIIIVDIIALVANASRGALFSPLVCMLMFILFSKRTIRVRILLCVSLIILYLVLNEIGAFTLIKFRLLDSGNTNEVGNRTLIWASKFAAFNELGISHLLFGVGKGPCAELGVHYSTHNDFVTAIIAYGAVGFLLFISLLLWPLRHAKKEMKVQTLCLLIFLMMECFVLEPLFRGYYIFWLFYLFICKLSNSDKIEEISK